MDELKRGFWGYKKDSVYRYIVSMEEDASARVAEKEARLEKLEAQKHAEHIKAESRRRERQVQEEIAMSVQRKTKQVDNYLEQIRMFRETVQAMLKEFDERAEEAERSLTQLRSQAPSADLEGDPLTLGDAPAAGGRAQRKAEQVPQEEEPWKKYHLYSGKPRYIPNRILRQRYAELPGCGSGADAPVFGAEPV